MLRTPAAWLPVPPTPPSQMWRPGTPPTALLLFLTFYYPVPEACPSRDGEEARAGGGRTGRKREQQAAGLVGVRVSEPELVVGR